MTLKLDTRQSLDVERGMLPPLENANVLDEELLPSPGEIKDRLPIPAAGIARVSHFRQTLCDILDRRDPRLFVVVGPCSIHDIQAARDYARRLRELSTLVEDVLFLVMRVYFCKPRTTVGWKGFINDPYVDGSFQIAEGLFRARQFLIELAELGLPVGTEVLDAIAPQYFDDLVSWNAIGARTTESQFHREIASGLSTPVGFKNGTEGAMDVAINALRAAAVPHHFLGINRAGRCVVLRTRGNRYGHVILRGGERPNYDVASVAQCEQELRRAGLPENIVIDCSHGNSRKDHSRQPLVFDECVRQILQGNQSIVGLMLESNLEEGRQDIPVDAGQLRYGVSITDACIDWTTTEDLLLTAAHRLRDYFSTTEGTEDTEKTESTCPSKDQSWKARAFEDNLSAHLDRKP